MATAEEKSSCSLAGGNHLRLNNKIATDFNGLIFTCLRHLSAQLTCRPSKQPVSSQQLQPYQISDLWLNLLSEQNAFGAKRTAKTGYVPSISTTPSRDLLAEITAGRQAARTLTNLNLDPNLRPALSATTMYHVVTFSVQQQSANQRRRRRSALNPRIQRACRHRKRRCNQNPESPDAARRPATGQHRSRGRRNQRLRLHYRSRPPTSG